MHHVAASEEESEVALQVGDEVVLLWLRHRRHALRGSQYRRPLVLRHVEDKQQLPRERRVSRLMSGLISRPDAAHVESGDEVLGVFTRQRLEVLLRREDFQLSVLRLDAPSLAKRAHQH